MARVESDPFVKDLPELPNIPLLGKIVTDVLYAMECCQDEEKNNLMDPESAFMAFGLVLEIFRMRVAGAYDEDPSVTTRWAVEYSKRTK